MSILQCGRFDLDLSRPRIMAIINLTTDSFSGDGLASDVAGALAQAEQALESGADLLDIGGESSRPGAEPVELQVELDRVMPVVEALASWNVPLSVDTVKPEVMRAVIAAGADLINDINAFRAPGAVEAVSDCRVAVCAMHMQGEPQTMQAAPHYEDVVGEVAGFLAERAAVLQAAGVASERIVLDPGFGFGKTLDHNVALLRALDRLSRDGLPMLVGLSRKSMVGGMSGRPASERAAPSAAAALMAVQRGARVVRVHDVAITRDVLRVWEAVEGAAGS